MNESLHLTVTIILGDHLESVETLVHHDGNVVRQHRRTEPTSLLTDAMRYVASGYADAFTVVFRGAVVVWRPGAYQITLDAFRLAAGVMDLSGTTPESILDVGCGSGVVGATLGAALTGTSRVDFLDEDAGVLALAEENASRMPAEVARQCIPADFSQWDGDRTYELIVSNPPYFPTGSILPERGHRTMTDELGLHRALIESPGAQSKRTIFTCSNVFAGELDAMLAARPDLDVVTLASWTAPISRALVASRFEDRFRPRSGSHHELEHQVRVLQVSQKASVRRARGGLPHAQRVAPRATVPPESAARTSGGT